MKSLVKKSVDCTRQRMLLECVIVCGEEERARESRKEEVTTAKKMRGSNAHATYTEEK